ncbi:MAG: RNA 2',3'-cyclic phosphodiesterase [Candidatus Omnitrophota bacterium]|nr:RNA 2',3'-cyclic phosphodiesterase [Candidatus Omnitrophota bacterium]
MRTFIAIELPKEVRDTLSQLQEELKKTKADVKWVSPENIHLTLKFLGERNEKKINQIAQILEEIAKDKISFTTSISNIGAFPKIDFPRVLWVGIDKGDKEIKEIVKELEEKIARLGIPKEDKPFSSHITLGRTRSTLNRQELVQGLNTLSENFPKETSLEFSITKLTFFKSTLTPGGPIYETLKEIILKTI